MASMAVPGGSDGVPVGLAQRNIHLVSRTLMASCQLSSGLIRSAGCCVVPVYKFTE